MSSGRSQNTVWIIVTNKLEGGGQCAVFRTEDTESLFLSNTGKHLEILIVTTKGT
jgi:hypothetical protein